MERSTSKLVKQALAVLASRTKAEASAWFFKTGKGQYGEGDQFIGVTVPEQRKVARYFRDLPLTEIETLLQSPIHEYRLTALFILVGQYQRGDTEAKKQLASFYHKHRKYVNNWDLVDSSASYILGDWLLNHPNETVILDRTIPTSTKWPLRGSRSLSDQGSTSILTTLALSASLWDRRIAMIASGAFIAEGDFDDTLKLAELLMGDKEDLIHKATGWMLREVGKHDEELLRKFLDMHAAEMPRTMLRYAVEKLSQANRKHYLAKRT